MLKSPSLLMHADAAAFTALAATIQGFHSRGNTDELLKPYADFEGHVHSSEVLADPLDSGRIAFKANKRFFEPDNSSLDF